MYDGDDGGNLIFSDTELAIQHSFLKPTLRKDPALEEAKNKARMDKAQEKTKAKAAKAPITVVWKDRWEDQSFSTSVESLVDKQMDVLSRQMG